MAVLTTVVICHHPRSFGRSPQSARRSWKGCCLVVKRTREGDRNGEDGAKYSDYGELIALCLYVFEDVIPIFISC